MTTLRTVWLVAAVAAAAMVARAQVPNVGWCPDHLSKTDFDMDQFMGTWYEAERYMSMLEAGSRCAKTDYTLAKDGRILVSNEIQNRLTGVKRVLNGEIRSVPKGTEAKINVKYTTLMYPFETKYRVLGTDYNQYAVVWDCMSFGIMNTQNAWVMTRERNPSPKVLQEAYGVLDKYKISRTFFVKTDQNNCQIAEAASEGSASEGNDIVESEEGAQKSAVEAAAEPAAEPAAAAVPVAVAEPAAAPVELAQPEQPAAALAAKPDEENSVKKAPVVEAEAKPAEPEKTADPEKTAESAEPEKTVEPEKTDAAQPAKEKQAEPAKTVTKTE